MLEIVFYKVKLEKKFPEEAGRGAGGGGLCTRPKNSWICPL